MQTTSALMSTLAPQVPATIFLMTSALMSTLALQVPASILLMISALMSTLAPQVLATIFLMTSIKWGIAFLQNVHLFNIHFQNSQTPQKRSILALQVPATIFLMTSFQWGIAFLQNDQLSNNHQTLQLFNTHQALNQKRRLCLPLAFLQNGEVQTNSPLTPTPSTFTEQTQK